MFKAILGTLILFLIFIILSIPYLLLSIHKLITLLVYSKRRILVVDNGEEESAVLHPTSTIDFMFVPGDSWTKGAINYGLVLKLERNSKISLSDLRNQFETCFLNDSIEGGRYSKLYSYLVVRWGHVFRAEKARVSVEENISEVDLTREESDDRLAETYLAKWMMTGYKKGEPCWEINLINLSDCQLVAFKIHHAIADGYSTLHILDKLTGNKSPYLVKDYEGGRLKQIRLCLEAILNFGRMKGIPKEKNPCIGNTRGEFEWVNSFTTIQLEGLQKVRRKLGVHLSSVLMAAIGGALEEFIKEERDWKEEELPDYIRFGLAIGVPRHPSREEGRRNDEKICNHFSNTILNVPFKISDPMERIKRIEADLEAHSKSGFDQFFTHLIPFIMWPVPVPSLLKMSKMSDAKASRDDLVTPQQAYLTSLIGGNDYSLLGCKVEEIHTLQAMHDFFDYMPVSFSSFSHSGKLELTAGAHPSFFKDQKTLNNFMTSTLHKELEIILEKCLQ